MRKVVIAGHYDNSLVQDHKVFNTPNNIDWSHGKYKMTVGSIKDLYFEGIIGELDAYAYLQKYCGYSLKKADELAYFWGRHDYLDDDKHLR